MADVKYTPLNADITLFVPKVSEKTAGGIIKDEQMLKEEKKKLTGALKVIHCGPMVPLVNGEPQIKPGDKVLLRDGAMMAEIKVGGLTVHQTDCYSVLGVIG